MTAFLRQVSPPPGQRPSAPARAARPAPGGQSPRPCRGHGSRGPASSGGRQGGALWAPGCVPAGCSLSQEQLSKGRENSVQEVGLRTARGTLGRGQCGVLGQGPGGPGEGCGTGPVQCPHNRGEVVCAGTPCVPWAPEGGRPCGHFLSPPRMRRGTLWSLTNNPPPCQGALTGAGDCGGLEERGLPVGVHAAGRPWQRGPWGSRGCPGRVRAPPGRPRGRRLIPQVHLKRV